MFKKTSFYIVCLILGIILIGAVFIIRGEALKAVSGVCLGLGSGLLGMSISSLFMKRYERKHPEIKKQNEVDYKDERNEMIRSRAKAKAGDIIKWLIIGAAYTLILADAPLWMTGINIIIFVIYHIVGFYYMDKYQREL